LLFSDPYVCTIVITNAIYSINIVYTKYLLIHVFLINFRQKNVKLVLLKEFKLIILDFVSEN